MRVTNSIVFGLVSLTCTVSAAKAPGKPVLAKRQALVTATKDGCTAVCVDLSDMGLGQGTDCDVYCTGGFSTTLPAKSTSTSTKIVTTTTKAALHQRTMTLGGGDCIATCWDLMPGTECDVQCKGDFEAEKPGNLAHISGANDFNLLALIFLAQTCLELHHFPYFIPHANI